MSKIPSTCDVVNNGEGHHRDGDKKIGNGEADQKKVWKLPETWFSEDSQTDQGVCQDWGKNNEDKDERKNTFS